uniref:G_PROTEIN_RECEP_F1_2 domain-containing protein n=1 Tax=Panagrellus redivivus TaxID=6233 RepID=A0A7E4V969_PANRE
MTGDAMELNQLNLKFSPEVNDYLRSRRTDVVYFKDADTTIYVIFFVNGPVSNASRVISTFFAVRSLKKYIAGRTLSNFTKNKLKVMTHVVISQAVVCVVVGIGPTYGLFVAGALIPKSKYAEELFLVCLLMAMQTPMAIAAITIYTVKPYQDSLRKVFGVAYFKIFKK